MRQPLKLQLQPAPSVEKALGDSLLLLRAPHQRASHEATSLSSDTVCLPSASPSPPTPCRKSPRSLRFPAAAAVFFTSIAVVAVVVVASVVDPPYKRWYV